MRQEMPSQQVIITQQLVPMLWELLQLETIIQLWDTCLENSTTITHNNTSVGYNSDCNSATGATALGRSAVASGDYSISLGYDSSAEGDNSIAIGNGANTNAVAPHSIAIGYNVYAAGGNIVIGSNDNGGLYCEAADNSISSTGAEAPVCWEYRRNWLSIILKKIQKQYYRHGRYFVANIN